MAGNNLFIVTVVTEEEQIKSIFQVDVDDDNNCTICAAVCGFHLSSCQISKYANASQEPKEFHYSDGRDVPIFIPCLVKNQILSCEKAQFEISKDRKE